jgi:hypothetical protein
MKSKILIGFFVVLVSTIMLMSNAVASAGPPIWINQTTISFVDGSTSQDPENSGYGINQVVVWEEWNGADWDIYMKYSNLDGALGSWIFSPVNPAVTVADEINPAVAVTNSNPITLATEIHVVYQIWSGVSWDVEHTWTNNFGVTWSAPAVLDATPANDAMDPAVVFTEDLSNPGPTNGLLVQFVWSEFNPGPGLFEIQYNAFYQDPSLIPVRGYIGPTLIRSAAGDCLYPEIASVDERLSPAAFDYYFSVVWQEQTRPGAGQWNILYDDGTTTTSGGGGMGMVLTPGSLGQLNPVNNYGDSYHPDIAATQDYALGGGAETYYFHVNWVFQIVGPPASWQIDTCYNVGPLTTPGAAAFIITAPARGPGAIVLDNPTIASKLQIPGGIPVFETWMCWEDSSAAASVPDIWYRVGQCPTAGPPFAYTVAAAIVPYVQWLTSEYNPELWNRNDTLRMFPPLTHLVFDMTQGPVQEVEYIDP